MIDDVAETKVVIWASVSDEVDAKIREQIKAGVFPVRLAACSPKALSSKMAKRWA